MFRSLKKWLLGWLKGGPHFVVGDPSRPYLHRWYVLPRNPLLNVYVHKFLRDDDDRAAHDHPWASLSLCLWRGYWEEVGPRRETRRWVGPLSLTARPSWWAHRVELKDGKPAWTLFLTGPRVREWGFHCAKGWVHWKDFTKPGAVGEVGRGCGDG